MRVAYLIPSLSKAAPIVVVKDLVDQIILNPSVQVKVFYLDEVDDPIIFNCDCERVSFFNLNKLSDFDVIHSHMFRPDLYLFLASFFSLKKEKMVTTLHQYNFCNFRYSGYGFLRSIFFSYLWDLLVSRHGNICVLTEHMKEYYSKRFLLRFSSIVTVNNGRPVFSKHPINPLIDLVNKLPTGSVLMGTASRIVELKGIDQCIKALKYLDGHFLVIMGDGEFRQSLELLAKSENVYDRCFFLGAVIEPRHYFQFLDIAIFPSRSEGFGLSLVEAASTGIPIVCSKIPAFCELFNQDEVSFYELDDISSLVQGILFAEREEKILSKNALSRYMRSYTSDIMASKYLNVYNSRSNY